LLLIVVGLLLRIRLDKERRQIVRSGARMGWFETFLQVLDV
jgi:hypothetical protein